MRALFQGSPCERSMHAFDLDIFPLPDAYYYWLEASTGVSKEKIIEMRLTNYEGYLQERIDSHPRQQWIVSMGHNKAYGFRYCPMCLDEIGYYKKTWRLMLTNCCEKHQCYLNNKCPKCSAPVIPQLLEYHSGIYDCHNCGFDLRKSSIEYVENGNNAQILIQKRLLQICEDGYYIFDNQWHYSVGLFDLLHHLLLYMGRESEIRMHSKYADMRIASIDPKSLADLLNRVFEVLEDWPYKFKKMMLEKKITNHFRLFDKKDWRELPYWFVRDISF